MVTFWGKSAVFQRNALLSQVTYIWIAKFQDDSRVEGLSVVQWYQNKKSFESLQAVIHQDTNVATARHPKHSMEYNATSTSTVTMKNHILCAEKDAFRAWNLVLLYQHTTSVSHVGECFDVGAGMNARTLCVCVRERDTFVSFLRM